MLLPTKQESFIELIKYVLSRWRRLDTWLGGGQLLVRHAVERDGCIWHGGHHDDGSVHVSAVRVSDVLLKLCMLPSVVYALPLAHLIGSMWRNRTPFFVWCLVDVKLDRPFECLVATEYLMTKVGAW